MKSGAVVLGVLLGVSGLLEAQLVGPVFRVNTQTTNQQFASRVSLDASARSVVVWTSTDQDGTGQGVFGQRFAASGGPLGGEFRVNTTTPGNQEDSWVASGDDGSFVVVWEGPDSAGCCGVGIFAQHFSAGGQPAGAEFRVNQVTTGYQYSPRAAMDGSGNFVVAWLSSRQDNFGPIGVFARRFNHLGAPLASEFRVSTDDYVGASAFSLDTDADGNFIVVWLEDMASPASLLGRRFASTGAPQGALFQVDTSALGSDATELDVAMEPTGEFVVAWSGQDVFAQRFSSAGVPEGAGLRVNSYSTGSQSSVALARGSGGAFLVSWFGNGPEGLGAFGRFFGASGEPLASDFNVGPVPAFGSVSLGGSVSGQFVATHTNHVASDALAGVFGQHIAPPLQPVGSELRVNTITTGPQTNAAVAELGSGGSVVVWSHGSGSSIDVVAQRFSGDGTPLGGEMRVNTFTTKVQTASSVAALASGGFVVVWQGQGDGDADAGVFGQLFAGSGSPAGGELILNTSTIGVQDGPRAALDGSGGFAAVWRDANPSHAGVYGQRFSGSGARVGAEFRVSTTTAGDTSLPSVAGASPVGFVVVWTGGSDVLGQRFASNGAALGGEFRASEAPAIQAAPAVSMDPEGRFVVAYSALGDGSGAGVFARRFSASGVPMASPFLVNTQTSSVQDSPAVASGAGGTFVVAWRSYLSLGYGFFTYGVFGQLYKQAGEPATNAFPVTASAASAQELPAVALGKGLTFAWQSLDPSFVGIYSQRFEPPCRTSDANGDGQINVSDVLYLINALFAGGPPPTCGGDANGDGNVGVSDVLYLINHLFAGGPAPV